MKRPLIIISTLAVLLVLSGTGYLLATGDSSPPEPPPPSAPPVQQPASVPQNKPPPKPPPPSFEEKMETLKQTIADVYDTGEAKEITLVFTEAEANTQAAKRLAQTELPEDIPLEIDSVHIDFQTANNVETEVRVSYGFKFTIKVKAQVDVKEGRLEIKVTEVNFGFVPLLKPIKDRIMELITEKINFNDSLVRLIEVETGSKGKVDLEFTNITIHPNKIAITIIVKPLA